MKINIFILVTCILCGLACSPKSVSYYVNNPDEFEEKSLDCLLNSGLGPISQECTILVDAAKNISKINWEKHGDLVIKVSNELIFDGNISSRDILLAAILISPRNKNGVSIRLTSKESEILEQLKYIDFPVIGLWEIRDERLTKLKILANQYYIAKGVDFGLSNISDIEPQVLLDNNDRGLRMDKIPLQTWSAGYGDHEESYYEPHYMLTKLNKDMMASPHYLNRKLGTPVSSKIYFTDKNKNHLIVVTSFLYFPKPTKMEAAMGSIDRRRVLKLPENEKKWGSIVSILNSKGEMVSTIIKKDIVFIPE